MVKETICDDVYEAPVFIVSSQGYYTVYHGYEPIIITEDLKEAIHHFTSILKHGGGESSCIH